MSTLKNDNQIFGVSIRLGDLKMEDGFIQLHGYRQYPIEEIKSRAAAFLAENQRRRTVREFSNKPVPLEVIEACLLAAGTAPSGANMQPWRFVVVTDPTVKQKIRIAAEKEEHDFYDHKATREWLDALAPLGTNERKPFLENAPHLIVIFAQTYSVLPDGRKVKHYYVQESVGIATGILITAVHHGYPAEGAKVPAITKKSLQDIATFI
jgi:iodotyrosine deiodinase